MLAKQIGAVAPTETNVSASTLNGESGYRRVMLQDLKRDAEVVAFLRNANERLKSLGYTEHGQRHASLVASIAQNILLRLGLPTREGELAEVAGYLHDIGNLVHRENHALSGALIALHILSRLQMSPDEIAQVMFAIGNHEEERGNATTHIAAAVIIADKADVHRSRVQNPDVSTFDIHDRVNYAAKRSFARVDAEAKTITLELEIDTEFAQLMEYFEIFLTRMTMVRQAAEFLGCKFNMVMNNVRLL